MRAITAGVDIGKPNRPKFGAHMSIAGGHYKAVLAASALGMNCLQLFTKSNNQWNAKPIGEADISAFREALQTTGIVDLVAHNSYLINLGSPVDELWRKSIDAMVVEIERAEALGIGDLVAHPGAHVGSGEEAALTRIAQGLDEIHKRTRGVRVRIDLETTAGQGTCLGAKFEHLEAILQRVNEPELLGICVDTCHVFAAGYALATREQYNDMMETLDRTVGLARVRVWHLNDSKKACGSRVDRHEGIGKGQMGLEPFAWIVNDPRFSELPKILETPKGTEAGEDLDAINLRALRQLVQVSEASSIANGSARPLRRSPGRRGRKSPNA